MTLCLFAVLAGSLASFPFEVIKTRIILGDTSNTPDIFSRIQTVEGFVRRCRSVSLLGQILISVSYFRMPGLYAGFIPCILASIVQTTSQEKLKKYFQEKIVPDIEVPSEQDPPAPLIRPHNLVVYETISAACSGAAISFLITPLTTIQLALQSGTVHLCLLSLASV